MVLLPGAQVLANMLANAVKFTERGEVVVTATVERLADGGGSSGRQRFHLTIRDTGIGIDPESMKKLFQCFRQGHESMTRKYGGTGDRYLRPYYDRRARDAPVDKCRTNGRRQGQDARHRLGACLSRLQPMNADASHRAHSFSMQFRISGTGRVQCSHVTNELAFNSRRLVQVWASPSHGGWRS